VNRDYLQDAAASARAQNRSDHTAGAKGDATTLAAVAARRVAGLGAMIPGEDRKRRERPGAHDASS
jgi:hypothetical protein